MANERKLTVILAGDDKSLSSTLRGAGSSTDGLGSKLASFGKVAAVGLGAVAVGAVAMGKSFVDAAVESQKVTKQTEAVLKSMGDGAGLTATQIANLSTKLSLQSGVDDELIQSGQNVLLTFGKVRNEVGKGNDIFTRASQSALDMSVALGTDLSSANIQLGKALNDPIKGITALSRAGVSFTEQQKEQIKTMVASGDTLGAQKIILGEMEKQFGGSAAAQATAGEKLKVAWGNLQEQLGARLLPVVEKVAAFLAQNLPAAMAAAGSAFNAVRPVFAGVGDVFRFLAGHSEFVIAAAVGIAAAAATVLVPALIAWASTTWAAVTAQVALLAPFIAIGVAIAAVAAGVIYAYQHFDAFRAVVDAVSSGILSTIQSVWPAVQQIITGAINAIAGVINTVLAVIRGDWSGAWEGIKQVVTGVWSAIQGVVGAALGVLRGVLSGGLSAASSVVSSAVAGILGYFSSMPGKIGGFFSGLASIIKSPFVAAFNAVKAAWNATAGGFGFSIPSWVPGVGGKSFRIPNMHTGGIVPGGLANEPLVRLQGGEGVFTPDQMQALGGLIRGGSREIVNHIVVTLDGKVIAEQTRTHLDRASDRNGYALAIS